MQVGRRRARRELQVPAALHLPPGRPEQHQPTIDRLCAGFGIAPTPVQANLSRVSEKTEVTNRDALRDVATREGAP